MLAIGDLDNEAQYPQPLMLQYMAAHAVVMTGRGQQAKCMATCKKGAKATKQTFVWSSSATTTKVR
jgi:hypothetical protein